MENNDFFMSEKERKGDKEIFGTSKDRNGKLKQNFNDIARMASVRTLTNSIKTCQNERKTMTSS